MFDNETMRFKTFYLFSVLLKTVWLINRNLWSCFQEILNCLDVWVPCCEPRVIMSPPAVIMREHEHHTFLLNTFIICPNKVKVPVSYSLCPKSQIVQHFKSSEKRVHTFKRKLEKNILLLELLEWYLASCFAYNLVPTPVWVLNS